MVYGRLAAFCGNRQQIGKKLCWLSDDLNVRTIMNIAAYKYLQVFSKLTFVGIDGYLRHRVNINFCLESQSVRIFHVGVCHIVYYL